MSSSVLTCYGTACSYPLWISFCFDDSSFSITYFITQVVVFFCEFSLSMNLLNLCYIFIFLVIFVIQKGNFRFWLLFLEIINNRLEFYRGYNTIWFAVMSLWFAGLHIEYEILRFLCFNWTVTKTVRNKSTRIDFFNCYFYFFYELNPRTTAATYLWW